MSARETFLALRAAASAWEPRACLVGNVQAGDIVEACNWALGVIDPPAPRSTATEPVCTHKISDRGRCPFCDAAAAEPGRSTEEGTPDAAIIANANRLRDSVDVEFERRLREADPPTNRDADPFIADEPPADTRDDGDDADWPLPEPWTWEPEEGDGNGWYAERFGYVLWCAGGTGDVRDREFFAGVDGHELARVSTLIRARNAAAQRAARKDGAP